MSSSQPDNAHPIAIGGLLYGAFIWGIIWYPYRLFAEEGVGGLLASLLTYGAASSIALLFGYRFWSKLRVLPAGMLPLALAAGWTNVAYILAVLSGEVVRVMLLFYLSPVWTLFLAHFWLKEHTNLKGVMVILLALCGAFVMLFNPNAALPWWQQLPLPQISAEWWALSAGMGFAISNVITRRSTHLNLVHKSFAVWVGGVVLSAVMLLLLSAPSDLTFDITHSNVVLTIVIALMLISATILVQYGVTRIPATRAAVIFLFELVVAAVAAYYLAGEKLSWNEWFGGAFIMLASVLSVRKTSD